MSTGHSKFFKASTISFNDLSGNYIKLRSDIRISPNLQALDILGDPNDHVEEVNYIDLNCDNLIVHKRVMDQLNNNDDIGSIADTLKYSSARFDNPKDVTKDKSHKNDYYHQIQGQMGIYGLDKCDLVIYTTKGICVTTVDFDPIFFNNMVTKLDKFYREHLLPYAISIWRTCDNEL
ncbi:unnamed protein product [Mytilus edulis]|uniref:Uncharacterized protein n=1 Tax=Mytilus edulis TaxID=6550 RepID=A0A8S3V008_MYTED|nr:unnamed protein product [Mytilus edulis]